MNMMSFEDFLQYKNKINSEKQLRVKIISPSMEPLIRVDQKLTVHKVETQLKPFDIIIFFQKDRLICHYIWHINKHLKKKIK